MSQPDVKTMTDEAIDDELNAIEIAFSTPLEDSEYVGLEAREHALQQEQGRRVTPPVLRT